MKTSSSKFISALSLSFLCLAATPLGLAPAYARGGFGGFGGGGRSFGGGGFGGGSFGGGRSFGGGSFGGGGRSFGGGSFGGGGRSFGGGRDFGGGNFGGGGRDFGGGNFGGGCRDFGGGNFGGGSRDFGGGNFAGAGRGFGGSGISTLPAHSGSLPTDGGLSNFGGGAFRNSHPTPINSGNLNNQGNKIRDNFNNNNRYANNNVNVNNFNHYGNNYGHWGGYGYGGYGGWGHWGPYGYPGGWCCPGWSEATAWTCMGLTTLTSFLGIGMMGAAMAGSGNGKNTVAAAPSVTNITYEGDNVYMGGQPVGTAQDYYQQAQQLAGNGTSSPATAADGDAQNWQPLGVFALAEPGQTDSNMMLQLAINKDGTLRGNYLNQLTNETSQVFGALDKKTQRVSWTIGNNNTTVFDAMLPDLVRDDSQVLVHYGPQSTKTMALIRLPAPKNGDSSGSDSNSNG